jgi:hypothetical protein
MLSRVRLGQVMECRKRHYHEGEAGPGMDYLQRRAARIEAALEPNPGIRQDLGTHKNSRS